ncbi:cell division protein FtsK [Lactobacillus sp.]|uniref:cell division protein FtsK n=1 Tax=Lactobacillus sp. TaxID=1591 RepID=UPI0025E24967|nr:cell division protein FtsK [Lactobacillus sp.]MCO6534337.1 cell division protein FtsK [Lactobacillus sp.]
MTNLENYLTRCLNMALGIEGETTYTNSFGISIRQNGFIFIPRFPAGYVLDEQLYQRIYQIANAALYPSYTLLKQNGIYFVPLLENPIEVRRGLYFPWRKGTAQRLKFANLDDYFANHKEKTIPLMKDFSVNFDKITSIAIAGNSGAGKSYFLTYLLAALLNVSKLIVIDPKRDQPSRWARDHGFRAIYPTTNSSKSDYVSSISEELSRALNTIYDRQAVLFEDQSMNFKPITIVIDEVLALTEGVNKSVKDSFFALLSQIALLGRATKVHLILCSQRLDHTAVPTSVREQVNVSVQLGNINKKTTQFLFPDLDPMGLVIPMGQGTGIIQVVDDEHPYNVLPFLAPTY